MKARRRFPRLPARVRLWWCQIQLWWLDRRLLRARQRYEALQYLASLDPEP